MAKRPIIDSFRIVERMVRCLETTPDNLTLPSHESEATAAAKASLTPAQRTDDDALRALVKEVTRYGLPGATSDHPDLHDRNGMPV